LLTHVIVNLWYCVMCTFLFVRPMTVVRGCLPIPLYYALLAFHECLANKDYDYDIPLTYVCMFWLLNCGGIQALNIEFITPIHISVNKGFIYLST
jgi:hypothetical protein